MVLHRKSKTNIIDMKQDRKSNIENVIIRGNLLKVSKCINQTLNNVAKMLWCRKKTKTNNRCTGVYTHTHVTEVSCPLRCVLCGAWTPDLPLRRRWYRPFRQEINDCLAVRLVCLKGRQVQLRLRYRWPTAILPMTLTWWHTRTSVTYNRAHHKTIEI